MDERRLKDVPLFAGLGKEDRRVLAKCSDEIDVAEGKVLAREGNLAYEFFVIERGTAEVTRGDEVLAELGPGDFFGEIGVLGKTPRIADVTATSAMDLIVLTSSSLRALNREQPRVAERLREALEQRLPQSGAGTLPS